jgi:predicted polyphosphate/ATP-dependent NAD kinase
LSTVGIIANPVSGKDIRRLVAHGSVFDNQEKVRIVRRLLTGLDAAGVDRVVYMPDYYGIVERSLLSLSPSMPVCPLEGVCQENNQDDSTRAGRRMEEMGVGCIVVLGGDGTNRAVMKGNSDVPVLPISTGTNNVFPTMVEATVAGTAAGLVATGRVSRTEGTYRASRLEILLDGAMTDLALVDVAVYDDVFIASRAIWDMTRVSQLFLTRARPENIGLSAIGGQLMTISPGEPRGMALELGSRGVSVTAPIAPGMFRTVNVADRYLLEPGEEHLVRAGPCVLALDGEREVEVRKGCRASVRLGEKGPNVVDVPGTMEWSRRKKLFCS